MNQTFMKEKKILPLVLSMALPMVLSMAVNSLYNIVDSYFIAKLSEDAMTALSLVYPVQNLITSVAVGFGVGINASIAFCLGAKEQKEADKAASQGLLLNLIHGILLAILCLVGMPAFLSMYTSNANVLSLALTYGNLAFLFSPVITVGITYEKIFQAIGWMKETMICMLVGFVANIILDPLLIFGIGFFPKWGIWGAAFATGSGQVLTLLAYLIYYYRRDRMVRIDFADCKPESAMVKRLYGVGIPATLNMALPSFLISVLNGILAGFSETYVLVLGVYYKLQTFIYLSANGIVQGIRPLVGYNYGAGEGKRVRSIYSTALTLSAFIMVFGTAVSWLIPGKLFGLFTSNADTLALGTQALRIISIGFIISAISVTTSGSLEGMGMGMPSLIISLMRYAIVIMPAAFLFSHLLGATGVWMAFPIAEIITGITSYLIWCKKRRLILQ
mgnify:CR=1 FL=1